jgi:hypothetical protein
MNASWVEVWPQRCSETTMFPKIWSPSKLRNSRGATVPARYASFAIFIGGFILYVTVAYTVKSIFIPDLLYECCFLGHDPVLESIVRSYRYIRCTRDEKRCSFLATGYHSEAERFDFCWLSAFVYVLVCQHQEYGGDWPWIISNV